MIGLPFKSRKRAMDRGALRIITRHRWLVVGIAGLAMIGVGIITLLTPTYEAIALLSMPQLSSTIPSISLVKSTEVEAQVISALRASLSPEEQVPGRLSNKVEVTTEQNIVRIRARSDTAKKAAMTTNAWADSIVKEIAEALRIEEEQLDASKRNLEAANETLRAFEEEHGFGVFGFGTAEEELQADRERVKSYEAEEDHVKQIIIEARTLRASAVAGRSTSGSTKTIFLVLNDLLQKTSTESKDDTLQFQVLHKEQQVDQQLLETYEVAMQSVEVALTRAKSLRETIQQGGSIRSPELVATLIVDLLQSGSSGYDMGLGFQAPSVPIQDLSPSQQIEILDMTISILESRKKLISAGMSQLSVKALDTLDAMISSLERKEAALTATIEQLSADISQREKELADKRPDLERLIEARDRAEETYESLLSRMLSFR